MDGAQAFAFCVGLSLLILVGVVVLGASFPTVSVEDARRCVEKYPHMAKEQSGMYIEEFVEECEVADKKQIWHEGEE